MKRTLSNFAGLDMHLGVATCHLLIVMVLTQKNGLKLLMVGCNYNLTCEMISDDHLANDCVVFYRDCH